MGQSASMRPYVEANRALWNAWTRLHVDSAFYDVEGFKAGRETLGAIERAALGDVRDKTLLHLQCHLGLDTLSWARQGAKVTGVDFSDEAIGAARTLAGELALPARFVRSDLYDLPGALDGRFDIVFTSHGVLSWLPDLDRWAGVIAHFLQPGGTFFILELHPFAAIFDDDRKEPELRLLYPYFHGPEPIRCERVGSYAVPDAPMRSVEHVWLHTMGDILGSLIRAGLRIEAFSEYPYLTWALFPWMERRPDGMWQVPAAVGSRSLPLMFSLTASPGVGARQTAPR
jgi:SAM-dependent methyltransferase